MSQSVLVKVSSVFHRSACRIQSSDSTRFLRVIRILQNQITGDTVLRDLSFRRCEDFEGPLHLGTNHVCLVVDIAEENSCPRELRTLVDVNVKLVIAIRKIGLESNSKVLAFQNARGSANDSMRCLWIRVNICPSIEDKDKARHH